MTVYEPGSVDDVARYQAKKLAKEGDVAFARACGEFARNDAFRSLNETIIANVGRDRDKGAMFARVPTGTETCAFCLILASRGAVYHSRKTAGERGRFHRGCDCKVVPSFEGDPELSWWRESSQGSCTGNGELLRWQGLKAICEDAVKESHKWKSCSKDNLAQLNGMKES